MVSHKDKGFEISYYYRLVPALQYPWEINNLIGVKLPLFTGNEEKLRLLPNQSAKQVRNNWPKIVYDFSKQTPKSPLSLSPG